MRASGRSSFGEPVTFSVTDVIDGGCRIYVFAMNVLMLIAGISLMAMGTYFIVQTPLIRLDDMSGTWYDKAGLYLSGLGAIFASAVGFRFSSKNRRKGAAFCYILMLLVVLLLQLCFLFSIFREALPDVTEITDHDLVQSAKKDACAKMFYSFDRRFEAAKCRLDAGFRDLSVTDPSESHTVNRYAGVFQDMVAEEDTNEGCVPAAISCDTESATLPRLFSLCVPKPGYEMEFTRRCSACRLKWYSGYINGSGIQQSHPELSSHWRGESGNAFCRCYGRMKDSLSRHGREVVVCVLMFVGLQVLLIVSVVYLVLRACFKPASEDVEWDRDETELASYS